MTDHRTAYQLAEDLRADANRRYRQAATDSIEATVKALACLVLDAMPNARYVELTDSDQSDGMWVFEVQDADGNALDYPTATEYQTPGENPECFEDAADSLALDLPYYADSPWRRFTKKEEGPSLGSMPLLDVVAVVTGKPTNEQKGD